MISFGRKFGTVRTVCTVHDAFTKIVKILQDKNISEAEDNARYIVSHGANIGYRLSDFHRNIKKTVKSEDLAEMERLCDLKCTNMPIQYVIGNWDFFGRCFVCKAPVLVPRPETEELVGHVLDSGILQQLHSPRILDIGAGSGVIGISLLAEMQSSHPHVNATCTAIDINETAVQLANMNAQNLLVRQENENSGISYLCELCSFSDFVLRPRKQYDKFSIIVSNPPYIPSGAVLKLEPTVRDFEDHTALDGGSDGLDIIKDILRHSAELLSFDCVDGVSAGDFGEVWLEVSHTHPALIQQWVEEVLCSQDTYNELSGEDTGNQLTEQLPKLHQSKSSNSIGNTENKNLSADKAFCLYTYECLPWIQDLYGQPRFVRIRVRKFKS